jgi:beta-N-acetylhexosaminidase
VVRIPEELPGQAELTLATICPTYLERSELLKTYGINLNFGIVADKTAAVESFIYPRVFRNEVDEKVAEAVTCTTETLTTLKHFPGHGMTPQDTHI